MTFEKSWADDDDSIASTGTSSDGIYVSVPISPGKSPQQKIKHYPITYHHHLSTYAQVLLDVDGQPLLHPDDETYLNVWTAKFNDVLQSKHVRCVHVPGRPGYRFFVTSEKQKKRFLTERERGFVPNEGVIYHVYDDEPGVIILPSRFTTKGYRNLRRTLLLAERTNVYLYKHSMTSAVSM